MVVCSKAAVVRVLLVGGVLLGVYLLKPMGHVSAQGGPTGGVRLAGVVRDFKSSHADFGLSPSHYGHVAGNVSLLLGNGDLPVLGGPGFEVDSQWYGRAGSPIAPHMYAVGPGKGVVPVVSAPVTLNKAYADTYNPEMGPYSSENRGPAPHYMIGSEMPEITAPTGLPKPIREWKRDANREISYLSEDLDCGRFYIANHHVVYIVGDVTVLCREDFEMENHGHIRLAPGASLTVYTMGDVSLIDQCSIGMGAKDHERIKFYNMGDKPFIVQNQCSFWGTVVSPYSPIRVIDGSQFFGDFTGESVHLENQVGFHIIGSAPSVCGYYISDTWGAPGMTSEGDISSAQTFSTWFREVPGQNVATRYDILLEPTDDGFLEFDAPLFYPVDGDLYGNEGRSHNENFTYQVGATFTFHGCQEQIVELQGSDDIWVYVDDRLVIDLGGLGANQTQVAELDRLDLVDGERYSFMVYFAHRSGTIPSFRLKTNLDIRSDDRLARMPVFAGYD